LEPKIGFQFDLILNKTKIKSGENITIIIKSQSHITSIYGWVETPLKKKYNLKFFAKNKFIFFSKYVHTNEKGFLTKDWNVYSINVSAKNLYGEEKKRKKYFYLKESEKILYFVFWVDDFGNGGELRKKDRNWYHTNVGPISYGLERDEAGHYNLSKLFKKYDFVKDYLSHHFHPFHWDRGRIFLFADNLIYKPCLKFKNYIIDLFHFDLIHWKNVAHFILILVILFFLILLNLKVIKQFVLIYFLLCFFIISFSVFLRLNHLYVRNYKNWTFEHNNPEWCKNFLINAKNDFNLCGLKFPSIVRHGWNLPPKGIMKFYMSYLGVLADASGVSGLQHNDYLKIYYYYDRSINWGNTAIPYFASLSGDYNKEWNGDEKDRGILEVPLTFQNFQHIKIDSKVIDKIKSLPNGSLISTYLHPHDDIKSLTGLVNFLKTNYYNVNFVKANTYVELYMKHYPRPILLDSNLNAFWAFLESGLLKPIRETDLVDINIIEKLEYEINYSLSINTLNEIPILQIIISESKQIIFDGKILKPTFSSKRRITIEKVKPGTHKLTFIN